MDIIIRRAGEEDLEAAGTVTVEAFVGDGHTDPDGDYVQLLRDARRRADEAELLVAVDGSGRVLGTVTFAVGGNEWANIAEPHEGEIRMLAVAPKGRGRGVGEALVRATMDRSRELGLTGMVLSTEAGMKPAHRIYERLGFERAPERDWSPLPGLELMAYTIEF